MTIYFGYDYGGASQVPSLKTALARHGEVRDIVADAHDAPTYVEVSARLASKMQSDQDALGVLICGTGIGVSIVANKHKGLHAARCVTCTDAEDCKMVNNANVLCLSRAFTFEAEQG